MRLDADREPKYSLRSTKAHKIDNTITQSLLSSFTFSFLVFGPGKKSEEFYSHRVPVKNLIEELKQIAAFPEDIEVTSEDDLLVAKELANNPATKELYLMKEKYDYTIILMISKGSISEYSLYLTKREVENKIKLYVEERYRNSQSYVMSGPVKAFEGVHKVYYFNDSADLLNKVKEMVIHMLILRSLQN
jgi:hypothetical protein